MSRVAFVTLRYCHRAAAASHLDGHRAWLRDGLQRGLVLLAGGLDDEAGGALLVRADDPQALRAFIDADPFVVHRVVEASIAPMTPALAAPPLAWILEDGRVD
jgi:uncharacterized protein YciI